MGGSCRPPPPRITLKGPRQQQGPDSASTPAPVVTGSDQASSSAAALQVISDTEVEEKTGGAEGSISGVEEDDEKAAKRAKVRPALTISDLATRLNQHVASGRHGVE